MFIFFFFSSRRRHTRCSRDWSSDVCSSDLADAKSWEQTKAGWLQQAKDDVEFGGKNFDASSDLANKAARQFFDEATLKWLQDTGLASYPGLWKGLVKLGKATADDKIDRGGGSSTAGEPTV